MNWAETIVQALKNWDTSLIAYVPDISIDRVTSRIDADPFFHLVSCSREEEAVPMGRSTRPILDQLGLVHFTLEDEYRLDNIVDGAMKLCHANRQPVAICLTQLLHGGKIA